MHRLRVGMSIAAHTVPFGVLMYFGEPERLVWWRGAMLLIIPNLLPFAMMTATTAWCRTPLAAYFSLAAIWVAAGFYGFMSYHTMYGSTDGQAAFVFLFFPVVLTPYALVTALVAWLIHRTNRVRQG